MNVSLMENGVYIARIVGQRIDYSPRRGTPHAAIDIQLIGQVDLTNPTGPPISCPVTRRTIRLWLTPDAIDRTVGNLRSIGWNGTRIAEFDERIPGHCSIRDATVFVICRHEDDGVQCRENWQLCSAPTPVDETRLADLEAQFGHYLRETKKRD